MTQRSDARIRAHYMAAADRPGAATFHPRTLDAIRDRHGAGESVTALAEDYGTTADEIRAIVGAATYTDEEIREALARTRDVKRMVRLSESIRVMTITEAAIEELLRLRRWAKNGAPTGRHTPCGDDSSAGGEDTTPTLSSDPTSGRGAEPAEHPPETGSDSKCHAADAASEETRARMMEFGMAIATNAASEGDDLDQEEAEAKARWDKVCDRTGVMPKERWEDTLLHRLNAARHEALEWAKGWERVADSIADERDGAVIDQKKAEERAEQAERERAEAEHGRREDKLAHDRAMLRASGQVAQAEGERDVALKRETTALGLLEAALREKLQAIGRYGLEYAKAKKVERELDEAQSRHEAERRRLVSERHAAERERDEARDAQRAAEENAQWIFKKANLRVVKAENEVFKAERERDEAQLKWRNHYSEKYASVLKLANATTGRFKARYEQAKRELAEAQRQAETRGTDAGA